MTPAQLAYQQYLESDHWRDLRVEAFKAYGRKCHKCPRTHSLEVHHLRYRSPWSDGVVGDLMILCYFCHRQEHGAEQVLVPKPFHNRRKRRNPNRIRRSLARRYEKWVAQQKKKGAPQQKAVFPKFQPWYEQKARKSRWRSRGNSSN